MIAFLEGKILDIDTHSVIVLTTWGIWYEVGINEFTFSKFALAEDTALFIYHAISEGRENLYWFSSLEERKFFLELIKISWVGGRVALNLLNYWEEKLAIAIKNQDHSFFNGVKGVWKKLSEKIFLDMKDKDIILWYSDSYALWNTSSPSKNQKGVSTLREIQASLVNMGYRESDVERELKNIPEWMTTLEEVLPYVIRKLS